MIRVIVATALICAAMPALAGNNCQYGSWHQKGYTSPSSRAPGDCTDSLTPNEQERVVDWFDLHEKINYRIKI